MRYLTWVAAAPLGIVTGLAAWLLADGAGARMEALSAVEGQVKALRPPRMTGQRPGFGDGDILLSAPIFAVARGEGAIREPSLRIDGVSISARRKAALVSIDGSVAEWMQVGDERSGVTLTEVTSSGGILETGLGSRQLAIGEQSAASAPADGVQPASPSVASSDGGPPVGFRSPPPPANAPPGVSP